MVLENTEQNPLEAEKKSFFSFFEDFEKKTRTQYSKKDLSLFIKKVEELSKSNIVRSSVVHQEIAFFLSQVPDFSTESPLSPTQKQTIQNLCVLIEVALATNQ